MVITLVACLASCIYFMKAYDSSVDIAIVWILELVVMDTIVTPVVVALCAQCCKIRNLVPYLRQN